MSEILQRAKEEKERAREQFKLLKRGKAGNCGAPLRLAKGDNSLTDKEKHRRRLKKNQDSSAAARYARKVYNDRLELCIQRRRSSRALLALEAARLRASRDALSIQVYDMQVQLAMLMGETDPEYAREYEEACSTKKLLESTQHLPEFRMTPADFAKSIMGVSTCPAL